MLRRSLQLKVATTFAVFMAIMAGSFFLYQQLALMPIFTALEREFVARDLERVAQTFAHEQSAIAAITFDWSAWDDTYEYVQNHDPAYAEANLLSSTFDNLNINLISIYDNSGMAVWGRVYDLEKKAWTTLAEFPPEGPAKVASLLSFPQQAVADQLRAGLMLTEKGLLLIASRPILDSQMTGKPRGVLAMGRLIQGENLEKLRLVAGLSFEVVPVEQLEVGHPALALITRKDAKRAMHVETLNASILVAWRPLLDMEENPRFLLKVTIARDIFRTAYRGLRSGVWLMVGGLLVLMAVLMVLVQYEVVRPIVRMSRHLTHLRLNGNYDQRFDYTETDELGRLARSLNDLLTRVAEQSSQLKDLSYEDSLTNVANRRCFNEQFRLQWEYCAREQLPLGIILCDIDDFKRFNDLYGHLEGDKCLHEVAQALKRSANKKLDLVARFGGEEFVILLPETTLLDVIKIAERIRVKIEALAIEHGRSQTSRWVTMSLGVASMIPTLECSSEILLHAADSALYRAKAGGRNRVVSGSVSAH